MPVCVDPDFDLCNEIFHCIKDKFGKLIEKCS